MGAYSFLDTALAISGPGGSFTIGGPAAGNGEGGFVFKANEKSTMTIGPGGGVMHSLHGDKSGSLTVSLLKTSPTNRLLMNMYNLQTSSSALHGQNTVTGRNQQLGDVATGQKVAFKKRPDLVQAKEAGMNEWEFDVGILDEQLGSGSPSL